MRLQLQRDAHAKDGRARASIGAFSGSDSLHGLPLSDGENADAFASTWQAGQSVVNGGLSFGA
jgi:hypothetical protein